MNFNDRTKTGDTPFLNLDAVSALKEISDGAAASCNGGKTYKWGSLECLDEQDGPGNDELSLQVNGKEVWQNGGASTGDKFSLDALKDINGSDTVKLFEKDAWPNGDDLIGEFTPDGISGGKSIELNQASARYKITFL